MRFKIGLTGGIACGKTSACRIFAAQHIPIVDADVISHELTAPGSPLLPQLAATFGPGIIAADGSLDRRAMRNLVFSDAGALQQLNALLHPAIHRRLLQEAEEKEPAAPYVVLAVPLLFEHHLEHMVDRILVLDCSEDLQLQRIMQRDGSSEAVARSIMNNQVSRSFRVAHADDLADTQSGSLALLEERILQLHHKYLQLAAAHSRADLQRQLM